MMTSIEGVRLRDKMMMLSMMLMKLLVKGDDLVRVKDQLCKMMWAKRPLTHNTPASAIIRIHLATASTAFFCMYRQPVTGNQIRIKHLACY